MLIIPARAVGFSIMVLEAQAAGLPIVALPALGMGAAGEHWATAVLARDETPKALAEAVLDTLSSDPTARIAEGRQIARRYDWSVIAPRVADVYRRVLGM